MIVQPGQRLVDYAARNKNPQAILAGGFVGAIRYICDSLTSWKHITLAERDALLDSGLCVALVWETSTTRPFAGAVAGHQDGLTARARLQWLGYPKNVPILLAFDTDITKATLAAATAYGRAFKAACGWPLIPYGDTDIGDALADITEGTWLPNASAWSRLVAWITGGNEHIVVRQRRTDLVNGWDPNDVVRPFTMWSKATIPTVEVEPPVIVVPAPTPAPTVQVLEEENPLQFIARSKTVGMALCTYVQASDNTTKMRMTGIEGDLANIVTIDLAGKVPVPVIDWDDATYLARAKAALPAS